MDATLQQLLQEIINLVRENEQLKEVVTGQRKQLDDIHTTNAKVGSPVKE